MLLIFMYTSFLPSKQLVSNIVNAPNATAAAKTLQSCLTLWDPIDGSQPGSSVPGILQARTLEWVDISSNAWKWKMKVKSLSRVRLLVTPWTAAYQAPPSMEFSRQEYWSGVPLPSLLHVASDYYVGSVVLGYLSAYLLGNRETASVNLQIGQL